MTRMHEFSGGLDVNSVFWLSALRDEEQGFSRTVIDDLKLVLDHAGCHFRNFDATSLADFESALRLIAGSAARNGMRPILHLDMHGSKELGLEIGATREFVPWPKVVSLFQAINVATGNNLCVVSASCFGFHAIMQITIADPCPFYLLIASENEVTLRFLADHTGDFYRDVFLSGNISAAFNTHLSGQMRVFNADRMLLIALARYIRDSCKGRPAAERREWLLTEVLLVGMPKTTENLRAARQKIKDGLRPGQSLLDTYVQRFLIGKKPDFTIDDVLDVLKLETD